PDIAIPLHTPVMPPAASRDWAANTRGTNRSSTIVNAVLICVIRPPRSTVPKNRSSNVMHRFGSPHVPIVHDEERVLDSPHRRRRLLHRARGLRVHHEGGLGPLLRRCRHPARLGVH